MLNAVPSKIAEAARLVTLRHPNSMPCVVFRKRTKRVDNPPDVMGGAPTMGGLGVLSSEDEEDTEWVMVDVGQILFTGVSPSNFADRDDQFIGESVANALIELKMSPGQSGGAGGNAVAAEYPDKHDVIFAYPTLHPQRFDVLYVIPGDQVVMPYEIVDVTGSILVPPYTRQYVLNARDDLNYLEKEIMNFPTEI